MRLLPRRSPALVAVAGFAALLLVPTAVQAAPVFTDANTKLNPGAYASTYLNGTVPGTACTSSYSGGAEPDVPIVENGPAAAASTSVVATFGDTNHPADAGTISAAVSASGSVKSANGTLTTLDYAGQGSGAYTPAAGAPATSGCERYGYAYVELDFTFTVAQAGFLTIDTQSNGLYGEAYVYAGTSTSASTGAYVESYGQGLRFSGTQRVYLPAGTYSGYFEAEPYLDLDEHRVASSGSTSVHASFAVAGAQTVAVAGQGKKYVTLPGARSCATHNLTTAVTSSKKSAQTIKQVAFFVNDAKVKKVKRPDKGQAVVLPLADDATADLRAEVTLLPAHKGRPAKVVVVSSSYEACS